MPGSCRASRSHIATQHPGGKKILLNVAGKDATKQFQQFHAVEATLARWGGELLVGDLASALPSKTDGAATQSRLFRGEGEHMGDMLPFADPMWMQVGLDRSKTQLRVVELTRPCSNSCLAEFTPTLVSPNSHLNSCLASVNSSSGLVLALLQRQPL